MFIENMLSATRTPAGCYVSIALRAGHSTPLGCELHKGVLLQTLHPAGVPRLGQQRKERWRWQYPPQELDGQRAPKT
jgi:hypothetical protein